MRTLLLTLFTTAVALAQCPGFPNCLYTGAEYTFTQATARISYQDITERSRNLEVTVRIPNRVGTLPVIIWAHGGEGRTYNSSEGALKTWAELGAKMGFLTVAPAFPIREGEDRLALCRYLGKPEGRECENFSTNLFDRPYDIKAIIDELADQNRSGPLRGRIDLARLAVGGHSAGSGGTLSVAGAARTFGGKRYGPEHFADPRPKAFIALSPSSPGSSAMFDTSLNDATTSWSGIERPVLFITGLGDVHEQFSLGRRIPYEYSPPGDKFRLWVNDTDFSHGAYGDALEDCDGVPGRKCAAFQEILVSTVRAFLEAYLEQKATARAFLEAGYPAAAPGGVLEWSQK